MQLTHPYEACSLEHSAQELRNSRSRRRLMRKRANGPMSLRNSMEPVRHVDSCLGLGSEATWHGEELAMPERANVV
jgi:hypothetical protein